MSRSIPIEKLITREQKLELASLTACESISILIVDDSGSTEGSIWATQMEFVSTLLDMSLNDPTGKGRKGNFGVYFLKQRNPATMGENRPRGFPQGVFMIKTGKDAETVSLKRPSGGTPSGRALKTVYDTYLADYEHPSNYADPLPPLVTCFMTDGGNSEHSQHFAEVEPPQIPADSLNFNHIYASLGREMESRNLPDGQIKCQNILLCEDSQGRTQLAEADDKLVENYNLKYDNVDFKDHKWFAALGGWTQENIAFAYAAPTKPEMDNCQSVEELQAFLNNLKNKH